MKSIGSAIVFCILGVASWLGSLFIQVVNRATARLGEDMGGSTALTSTHGGGS
jgi:hypothetical protein